MALGGREEAADPSDSQEMGAGASKGMCTPTRGSWRCGPGAHKDVSKAEVRPQPGDHDSERDNPDTNICDDIRVKLDVDIIDAELTDRGIEVKLFVADLNVARVERGRDITGSD